LGLQLVDFTNNVLTIDWVGNTTIDTLVFKFTGLDFYWPDVPYTAANAYSHY